MWDTYKARRALFPCALKSRASTAVLVPQSATILFHYEFQNRPLRIHLFAPPGFCCTSRSVQCSYSCTGARARCRVLHHHMRGSPKYTLLSRIWLCAERSGMCCVSLVLYCTYTDFKSNALGHSRSRYGVHAGSGSLKYLSIFWAASVAELESVTHALFAGRPSNNLGTRFLSFM